MLSSIFESVAEQGIRFSYLGLYLSVRRRLNAGQAKYRAQTKDYKQFLETPPLIVFRCISPGDA